MERAKGIEPSYAAWEAAVLPLNYARKLRFVYVFVIRVAIFVVNLSSTATLGFPTDRARETPTSVTVHAAARGVNGRKMDPSNQPHHLSALAPKADTCGAKSNVRFGPIADIAAASDGFNWTKVHPVFR